LDRYPQLAEVFMNPQDQVVLQQMFMQHAQEEQQRREAEEIQKRLVDKGKRWESVEAFLYGWARARRLIIDMDPTQDLVMIRPDPGKQPPSKKPPKSDASQPSLFDSMPTA
jgi:hypothetical protein